MSDPKPKEVAAEAVEEGRACVMEMRHVCLSIFLFQGQ